MPFWGYLWGVATPIFQTYKIKGYNASAKADAKSAYTAAQAFFVDSPSATFDLATLERYGLVTTKNVTTTVISGTHSGLSMTASHLHGNIVYRVSPGGINP